MRQTNQLSTNAAFEKSNQSSRPWIVWHRRGLDRRLHLVSGGPREAAMNLLGFIPLGMVLVTLLSARPGRAMALVAATAIAIELAQIFLPGRVPSLADLFLNLAGGATGIAIVLVLWRRRLAGPI